MDKAGYDLIQQAVQPLGGEVYPIPGPEQDIADLEIRLAIGSAGVSAEFHPANVIGALREAKLLEGKRGGDTVEPPQPKLRFKGMVAGSVWYTFSQRGSRPDIMLFEDTAVTESPY